MNRCFFCSGQGEILPGSSAALDETVKEMLDLLFHPDENTVHPQALVFHLCPMQFRTVGMSEKVAKGEVLPQPLGGLG